MGSSQDIDLLIYLKDEDIGKMAEFCRKNKLAADEEEIKGAFRAKSHVTIFDDESSYRLDIKGVYDELDKLTFSRRKKVNFRDLVLFVNTPEDSILAKLVYGSQQDLNDAKTMLLRQKGKLDMGYLKKEAKHFHVSGALSVLLKK